MVIRFLESQEFIISPLREYSIFPPLKFVFNKYLYYYKSQYAHPDYNCIPSVVKKQPKIFMNHQQWPQTESQQSLLFGRIGCSLPTDVYSGPMSDTISTGMPWIWKMGSTRRLTVYLGRDSLPPIAFTIILLIHRQNDTIFPPFCDATLQKRIICIGSRNRAGCKLINHMDPTQYLLKTNYTGLVSLSFNWKKWLLLKICNFAQRSYYFTWPTQDCTV